VGPAALLVDPASPSSTAAAQRLRRGRFDPMRETVMTAQETANV
jgi:hypothetical protein